MVSVRRGLVAIAAACLAIAPFSMSPASAAFASTDAPKANPTVLAVEYYHADLDHYFISVEADEIQGLDTHYFAGWERTGRQFFVFPLGTPGLASTCRFFSTAFGPKTSHFYTAYHAECEYVKQNPDWQFEGERFSVALPDGAGNCPADTVPLYRVFNNGHGGAPNHRFMTSQADRQAMLALGYADEGVQMCVGAPPVVAGTAEGKWRGTTPDHRTVDLFVLADGSYYAIYGQAGGGLDAGVFAGASSSSNGNLASTSFREFLFRKEPPIASAPQSFAATYVAKQSMQATIGGIPVTLSYDAAYDQPVTVAPLAGNYSGNAGHYADPHDGATATWDSFGSFGLASTECLAAGTLTPHGSVGVYDALVVGTAMNCVVALPALTPGVAFFDATTHQVRVLVRFQAGQDLWFFTGGR